MPLSAHAHGGSAFSGADYWRVSISCSRPAPARMVSLVLAMILARLLDHPASKLAMARQLDSATATLSLDTVTERLGALTPHFAPGKGMDRRCAE